MLPLALNLGIQWSGHRRARGSGRPAAPLPSPPRQPWFSGARRKCEPALLASLLACCSTNPPNPHFCTPRAPPLSTSALSDSKREGAVGAQGCRPAKQVSQRPPALTPGERAERPQVGSLHPRVRGAGGGRETPRGSRSRWAETHRRTPRSRTGWSCWTLPSPCAPRDASRSAPERTPPPLPWPGRSQPPRPPAHGKVRGTRRKHQPPDSACTSCSAR